MSLSPIRLVGNRIFDHSRCDVGRLRKRRRRPELGGHPHNYVLQSGAAQAWIGSSRKDALATRAGVASVAQVQHVPTHTLIQQPAVAPTPGEALWRRYRRAPTAHAARADRRTAMRRAAAETITQHLVDEHGLDRPGNPAVPPTGPEQPWRVEPLMRLYHRLS